MYLQWNLNITKGQGTGKLCLHLSKVLLSISDLNAIAFPQSSTVNVGVSLFDIWRLFESTYLYGKAGDMVITKSLNCFLREFHLFK